MFDHITPVLATLHWLPVKFRIDFKILLLAFKAVNGLAPAYLPNLLPKGDRAFTMVGPKLWNSL